MFRSALETFVWIISGGWDKQQYEEEIDLNKISTPYTLYTISFSKLKTSDVLKKNT